MSQPSIFEDNLPARQKTASVWQLIFLSATVVGIIFLSTLLINILNSSFGYVALEARVPPETLAVNGVPLEELPKEELVRLLQEHLSSGAFNKLENEKPFEKRSRSEVYDLVISRIVKYKVCLLYTS
ncbi:MAG: hypothetical protein N2049_10540, partial [Anaerolineales bacterium]|nr:hypothetical protein [Anaerolineales bacterium]